MAYRSSHGGGCCGVNHIRDAGTLRSEEELDKLTKELNKELGGADLDVKFAYDEKLEELYVMVYEHSSEKLLRKIPSEDAMNLSIKMKEIVGVLLDKNAQIKK